MYESMEKPPYLMGGFAQHGYVLPGSGRVRIPDGVESALASLSSCAFRSVVNAVGQIGAIDATDTVIIQGTGPLGILATGICKVAGAKRVIAIGAPSGRLELAAEFGADQTISIEEHVDPEDRTELVLEETAGLGADIVFEFSGQPEAFAEGLNLVRKGGRYMVGGQLGTGSVQMQPSLITKKNLSVLGSYSGDVSHYWKALQFIEEHQTHLPFHKLLTNKYGLEEVTVALRQMQSFREIKPLVYPGK